MVTSHFLRDRLATTLWSKCVVISHFMLVICCDQLFMLIICCDWPYDRYGDQQHFKLYKVISNFLRVLCSDQPLLRVIFGYQPCCKFICDNQPLLHIVISHFWWLIQYAIVLDSSKYVALIFHFDTL